MGLKCDEVGKTRVAQVSDPLCSGRVYQKRRRVIGLAVRTAGDQAAKCQAEERQGFVTLT